MESVLDKNAQPEVGRKVEVNPDEDEENMQEEGLVMADGQQVAVMQGGKPTGDEPLIDVVTDDVNADSMLSNLDGGQAMLSTGDTAAAGTIEMVEVYDEEGNGLLMSLEEYHATYGENPEMVGFNEAPGENTTVTNAHMPQLQTVEGMEDMHGAGDGGFTQTSAQGHDPFDEQQQYDEPLILYSSEEPPDFDAVATLLRFTPAGKLNDHWLPLVRLPLNLRYASFIVDLSKLPNPKDCHVDGYGSWGNANGSYHLFKVDKDERSVIRLDRGRNIDERRKSITDFDFKVTRLRYRHPVEKNFLKTIYTIATPRGVPKRSFVAYEWHTEPYEVYGLPHGNARYTVDSYQPAMASEREARTAVRKPLLTTQRRRRRLPDEHRTPRVRQIIDTISTSPAGTLPMFPVPDRLIVFSTEHFPSTQHAAHVLRFSPDTMFNRQWAKVQLPTHVVNAAFLVDLSALERQIDVHVDAYGSWGIPGSFSNFYDADDERQQLIRKDCGDVERRTRPENFEFRVQCCRYNHPSEPKFRKIIYKLIDCHENALRALVWYQWETTPCQVPPLHKSNESRHERRYPIVVPSFDGADFSMAEQTRTIQVHETKSTTSLGTSSNPAVVAQMSGDTVEPNNMNDGMIVYSTTTPPIFDTIAAHLYFFDEQKLNNRWSGRTKLPEGTRHVAYLVDVTSLGDPYEHHFDSFGTWSTPSTAAHYYDVNVDHFEAIRVDVPRNRVPAQYAFKCQVHRFRHMSDARFRKYIYTLCDPEGMPHRALIYYTWLVEPRELAPTMIHANSSQSSGMLGATPAMHSYYRDLTAVRIGSDGVTIDDTIPRDYVQTAAAVVANDAPKREEEEEPIVDDDMENISVEVDETAVVTEDVHTTGAKEDTTEAVPQLIYNLDPTPSCDMAAQKLWYSDDIVLNKQWARIHVDFSVSHVTFLVDLLALAHPKLCQRDSHGRWAAPSSATHFYRTDDVQQTVERMDVGKQGMHSPRRIPSNSEYTFKVQQLRFRNLEDASLRKTVYTLVHSDEKQTRALVHYARGEPSGDEQRMLDDTAETATPDMQETLTSNSEGRVVLYSAAYSMPGFDEAAHIMHFAPPRKVNRVWNPCRLPEHMRYASFLVDNRAWRAAQGKDAYGLWGTGGGGSMYYEVQTEDPPVLLRLNTGRIGRYQVPTNYDMRVTRLRYRHPMEPNFRRVVYQMLSPDAEASRVLVCYEWATEPHQLQLAVDSRPRFITNKVPTVPQANVYILESERELVSEQQKQVLIEVHRPVIPRQRRGRIPIETPIHSRHDVQSAQEHIDRQQQMMLQEQRMRRQGEQMMVYENEGPLVLPTPINVTDELLAELQQRASAAMQRKAVMKMKSDGNRYAIQDNDFLMQAVREGPGQYRCMGIPVPNVETSGCEEYVQSGSLICMHSLAAAMFCKESDMILARIRQHIHDQIVEDDDLVDQPNDVVVDEEEEEADKEWYATSSKRTPTKRHLVKGEVEEEEEEMSPNTKRQYGLRKRGAQ